MDTVNNMTLNGDSLPFSLEAEQSVLGAVLLDFSCISDLLDTVKPDSFYRKMHKDIFSVMLKMFTAGTTADFVTILEEVKRAKIFQNDDDAKVYLTSLVQIVPSTANVRTYAKIVQDKYYLRSLITAAQAMVAEAADSKDTPQNVIDSAEQRIFEIRQGKDSKGLTRIDEIMLGAYDRLQKLASEDKEQFRGLPSGFASLDNIISGLNRSDLIILAARPGMGKTSFALNVATNVARKTSKDVAIFSLEMSKEQLATRILSSESRVGMKQLQNGELSGEDWERLAVNAQQISNMPIYVDDTSGLSVSEIKAKARRLRNLGLIVIDYLQLMEGSGSDNRVQEVSAMTRALKIMAKDLNVPVITLSQLSRASDRRDDKRPMLADLRESGSIEQDADIVLFLYRDSYYNKESEKQNIAECIIAKNRHGETNTVEMAWDGKFTKFTGLEKFKSEN